MTFLLFLTFVFNFVTKKIANVKNIYSDPFLFKHKCFGVSSMILDISLLFFQSKFSFFKFFSENK